MANSRFLLSVTLIALAGCTSQPERLSPMVPTGPAPNPTPPITFNLEFPDWLAHDRTSRTHQVAAPADGTFAARLTWDPLRLDGTLRLTVKGRAFPDSPTNCSPIVAQFDARAGETHDLTVSGEASEFSHFGVFSSAYLLTLTFEENRPGVPSAPAPPPPAQAMGSFAEIRDTYLAGNKSYSVTAPADGTLVGRLEWNAVGRDAARLGLALGSTWFLPSPPAWSPVVGRMPVQAGQTCRVDVAESFAVWDYFFDVPFVVTFAME